MDINLKIKMLFLIFLTFLPQSWSFSNSSSTNQYVNQPQRTRHNNNKIHPSSNENNFLLVDYLPDGEMERRISYNGITAIQTSVGNSR